MHTENHWCSNNLGWNRPAAGVRKCGDNIKRFISTNWDCKQQISNRLNTATVWQHNHNSNMVKYCIDI